MIRMRQAVDATLLRLKENQIFAVYFSFWLVYFAILWARIFTYDVHGNLLTRNVGVWGDWAVHLTMGSAMAFRDLVLDQSPLLVGAPFLYPFFSNMLSALLIRAGVPFLTAFTLPSFVFSLFFISALYFFYRLIFKSALIALISSLVFLFNGGWGFLYYLKDIAASSAPWRTVLLPPKTYTNMEPLHIKWTSVIDTMLVPQRAFQLGFPMGLVILMVIFGFLYRPTAEFDQESNKSFFRRATSLKMGGAGLLFGMMPIVHTHSFVALGLVIVCWCLGDWLRYGQQFFPVRFRTWGLFGFAAVLVAGPLLWKFPLFGGGHVHKVQWLPGWYAHEWGMNFLAMWWKNWGVTLAGAVGGFLWWLFEQQERSRKIGALFLVLPFVLLFIISNLFLFHPWIWDNTKFLIWASLGFSGFGGYFIVKLGYFEARSF